MIKLFSNIGPKSAIYTVMSKNKSKSSKKAEVNEVIEPETNVISLDKSNNILIQIHAKPGAKQNKITGISSEGVNVQISAPPNEGEANTELVRYVASVLGLRKSDVIFEKGFKSRSKTLKILGSAATLEKVRQKIEEESSVD